MRHDWGDYWILKGKIVHISNLLRVFTKLKEQNHWKFFANCLSFLNSNPAHSVSYLFSPLSIAILFLGKTFDIVSSNIDKILSVNHSANAFFLEYLHAHQRQWLTFSGGNRPGQLCYNSSICKCSDLPFLITYLTAIPDCNALSTTLLDVLLASEPSHCSEIASHVLWNSDVVNALSTTLFNVLLASKYSHCSEIASPLLQNSDVVAPVSLAFLTISKAGAPFNCRAFHYFCAD